MTEQEWITGKFVGPLRNWIANQRKKSLRKLRLFGCACCRRLWDHLPDERSRGAVEAAEKYADGVIDKKALARARLAATSATHAASKRLQTKTPWPAESAAQIVANLSPFDYGVVCSARCLDVPGLGAGTSDEREQATLIRDIFGNPFRPVAFAPEWRSDTALSLAKHIYEARDFAQMPILADALQDAGCDNTDILNHCRDPQQTHVRGCWVVDLVLGKE